MDLGNLPTLPKLPDFQGTSVSLPDLSITGYREPKEPVVKPYVRPAKPVEAPKEAEPFGFITNLPKSTLNMAKGVFVDLPVSVAKTLYHYASNPDQYGKDFNLMVQGNSGLGQTLWHEMSDYYTKDFWHNFNEDPARGLTDVAAALSGIGSVGKLATEGSQIARIGAGLTQAAHYVDPLSGSLKLATKALSGPLAAIGLGEHTQDLERISRGAAAREGLEAAKATRYQLFRTLTPEEGERLERLIVLGVPEEIDQELAHGGKVAERLRRWSSRISETEEPYWKQQKLLQDDDMIRANAKAIHAYTSRNEGLPIPSKVAEELIRDGSLKPTYMSMFRVKNPSTGLYEALNSFETGGRKLGRLEERLGRGEYLTDLDEIQARQIQAFHNTKYKLSLLDEAKQMLLEKGKLLLARTPDEVESAIGQGYRRLDDEFARKYWNSYNRATQMQLSAMSEAAKTGANNVEALANAAEKFKSIESFGHGAKALLNKADVYVPADAAAWLNRELAPASNGWRLYDKWLGRFKSVATVFNPRFWSSVIFGNALLGTMYGLSPDMIRIAMKYKGDLPPALKQLAQHEIFLRDLGIYDRVSTRLGEAASRLDNFYKNAIFVSEVAHDSKARMMKGLKDFFISQEDVLGLVRHYSEAPELLSQTRLGVAQMQREMAEQLGLRDKSLVALRKAEKLHTKTIERLLAERQISYAELSAAIDVRKDVFAKSLADVANLNPKYSYFSEGLISELKKIRTTMKQSPEMIDKQGVVTAMDASIHAVAQGKPELLRYTLKQMKKAANGSSTLVHNQQRLSVFLDMIGAAETRVKEHTASLLRNAAEGGLLAQRIPGMRTEAAVAERAIDTGNKWFGSYNDLLPFEKQVIRRIVPFYTFTKAMTKLAFQFPYLYPKRTFLFTHLARAWNDVMHDDNAFLPSWAKQYIPVAGTEDGGVLMVRLGSFTPLANVRMGNIGQTGLPGIADVMMQHPVLHMMYDLKGGIPEWSKRPMSPGESAVRLDNGDVIKWTGTGFQTEIAQPSIWKSLFGLFPQAQLIHTVLSPYAQTDRGWLFHPEPIKDPSGKPRYPKELSDILMSFVVPTTTVKEEELKRTEMVRVAQTVKEFRRELRTAPPERREDLVNALREWAKSRMQAVER